MRTVLASLTALFLCAPLRALPDPRFDATRGEEPRLAPEPGPVTPAPRGAPVDDRVWVGVAAESAAARTAAASAGLSIEEILPGAAYGVATPRALARLRARGLRVIEQQPLGARLGSINFPSQDADYHNYAETTAELRRLAQAAPELVSLFSIGRSLEGREIWALRLNAGRRGAGADEKPGIVFLGAHHAREHLSTEVPLRIAARLVEQRGRPEIARLLAGRDVYFIPMVNPDGAEYDLAGDRYHMHRKNTRPNPDGSTGVDLNRNYSWGWGGEGASPDPADDTYHGPAAFSEPETRAVKAFVESRSNLKILLSYHTFSELILYPWGGRHDAIGDAGGLAAFRAMAQEMAGMTGYRPLQASGLYIATGDTCDWAWGERGIFAFTFELTPKTMWTGGFYPGAAIIATTVQSNWRPVLYLIDLADNPRRAARGVPAPGPRLAAGMNIPAVRRLP